MVYNHVLSAEVPSSNQSLFSRAVLVAVPLLLNAHSATLLPNIGLLPLRRRRTCEVFGMEDARQDVKNLSVQGLQATLLPGPA